MSDWPIRSSRSGFRAVLMLSALHPVPELRRRGVTATLALCLLAAGCASSGALRRGRDAEQRRDYDVAVVEYTKAVHLHPDDTSARLALDRAKLRASQDHFARGRRLTATGRLDQALVELEVASELNPTNGDLDDELRATRNKLRAKVAAAKTVVVIPDTPAKRREYEEEVVRTFYLSNADLKETMDLLRMVLDARRISPTTATNALTIKDTPERIAAAARVLSAIDKARPEVIIDVELLEVNRTKLQEYGLQIASPAGSSAATGLNGTVSVTSDAAGAITLQTLRNLTQSDILFAGLPSLYYRLLKTDSHTRTLANPQLRTTYGISSQARFGEQVPVPVTTFTPFATGGTAQQPITSFNYQNVGVNIDITPRTHHDDDVSLTLKIAVTNISGTGFGGLPTFGNREINTIIRLR